MDILQVQMRSLMDLDAATVAFFLHGPFVCRPQGIPPASAARGNAVLGGALRLDFQTNRQLRRFRLTAARCTLA
jgi:hypothetical protein